MQHERDSVTLHAGLNINGDVAKLCVTSFIKLSVANDDDDVPRNDGYD